MTDKEKAYCVYGYIRRLAEEMKEDGLFQDLSVNEVLHLILLSYLGG